jgi:hypothetical protein
MWYYLAELFELVVAGLPACEFRCGAGGVTHPASSKYHDEIISLVFIHTKYGEPIVIMVFRRTIQKVLCLTPPCDATLLLAWRK